MNLTDLKPNPESKKKKKRKARGRAGYGGKTRGRGHNGQGQRAGCSIRKQFEGGQTPLYRRVPKKQYISTPCQKVFTVLNISDLNKLPFEGEMEITSELLIQYKIIKKLEKSGLKILGKGDLSKKVKIKAQACSKAAVSKIQASGGSVEII